MRSTLIALFVLLLVALSAGVTVDDASAAKKRKPTAKACPAGSTPIVVKKGRKAGAQARQPRPAALQIGQSPRACGHRRTRRAAGRSGRGRARARPPTSIRRRSEAQARHRHAPNGPPAEARSHGLAKDGRSGIRRRSRPRVGRRDQDFSEGAPDGKASFGVEKVEGDRSGFRATASAEMKVSRADIEKFSTDLKDKLPADVTGASAKVDVSFEDVATTCPDDKGAVPGKLRGKGSITVTVERSGGPPIEVKLSAEVDTTYTAQIGADGKVSAINGVEVQTTFQTGGSGKSTETYRGRVVGTGFGKDGILDAPTGKVGARHRARLRPHRLEQRRGLRPAWFLALRTRIPHQRSEDGRQRQGDGGHQHRHAGADAGRPRVSAQGHARPDREEPVRLFRRRRT